MPLIEAELSILSNKEEQEIQVPLKSLRAVTVTGKVTGENGEPLKGTTLYGSRPDRPRYDRKLATTNADGTYSFPVPVGETVIRVFQAPQGYSQPLDFTLQSVTVSAGATGPVTGPDFVLAKAISLLVRVIDETGQPQANAVVKYFSSRGDLRGVALYTGAEGTQISLI